MRRLTALFLLLCSLVIIQGAFLSPVAGDYLNIDITFTVCVLLAILLGWLPGALIGLLASLILDLFFGRPLGITGLSLVPVCIGAGLLETRVFKETPVVPAIVVFLAVIVNEMLLAAVLPLMGVQSVGLTLGVRDAVTACPIAFLVYTPISKFALWLKPEGRRRL